MTKKQKGCQPDITVINKEKGYGILIDIAIVNTNRIKETFKIKIESYNNTSILIKQEYKLSSIMVIPVIITNDGLIHKQTITLMNQFSIKVDWNKAIREVLHINQELIIKCYSKRSKWRDRGRKEIQERR